MNFRKFLLASFAATGAVSSLAGQALAQEAQSGSSSVGEVVVTAERRSQSLQDVPVAVTAFTAEQREETGIISAQQQLNFTPGVHYTEGTARVSIRGVGRTTDQFGTEPGVAVYSDGFYVPSIVGIGGSTLRQERTEVLRGPQGTLYGRNSIGGAINTISRRPSDEFEGEIRARINDYNGRQIEGRVSGPITDHLRFSFSSIVGEQEDGYFQAVCEGSVTVSACRDFEEGGVYESWDADIQVSYDMGSSFDGWARFYTTERTDHPRTAGYVSPYAIGRLDSTINPTYGGINNDPASVSYLDPNSNPGIRDPRLFTSNLQATQELENVAFFTTENTFHLDTFDIRYIGGYQHYDSPGFIDGDATARNPFTYDGVTCLNPAYGLPALLGLNTTQLIALTLAGGAPVGGQFGLFTTGAGYLDSVFNGAARGPGGDQSFDCDVNLANGNQFGQVVNENDLLFGTSVARNAFSHEITLTSTHDGPLQWLVGVYYFESDDQGFDGAYSYQNQPEILRYYNDANPLSPLGNPDSGLYLIDTDLVVKSAAIYGQLDYDFNEQWHGTFGLRYSHDRKYGFEDNSRQVFWFPYAIANDGTLDPSFNVDNDGDGELDPIYLHQLDAFFGTDHIASYQSFAPLSSIGTRNLRDSWGAVTGTLGLQWTPNDDTLVYGRYSRGYKAGGFNLGTLNASPIVDEETIDAYELGWKQAWGPMQFNSALFFYQYHDLQVTQAETPAPGVTTSKLVNLPEVESLGFEIETIWNITEAFRVFANYTYLDTEITEAPLFIDAHDPYAQRAGARPSGPPIDLGPGVLPGQPQLVTGNQLPAAPEQKFSINATYTFFMGNAGELSLSATHNWRDDSYYTIFNTPDFLIEGGETTDLRAVYRTADERFSLIGSVTNVFDEDLANGFTTLEPTRNFFQIIYLEPPRVISLEAQYRF